MSEWDNFETNLPIWQLSQHFLCDDWCLPLFSAVPRRHRLLMKALKNIYMKARRQAAGHAPHDQYVLGTLDLMWLKRFEETWRSITILPHCLTRRMRRTWENTDPEFRIALRRLKRAQAARARRAARANRD